MSSSFFTVQLLGPSTEHRFPPRNLRVNDAYLFQHEYHKPIDPCFATRLSNVDIIGPTWLQFPNIFPVDNLQPRIGKISQRKYRLRAFGSLFDPPRYIDEVLWVHDDWSGGYFHWLTDVCPKLVAWKSSKYEPLPLLLPIQLNEFDFVTKSLDLLGFEPLWYEPCERIFVRNLWIIGPTAKTGNYRSALIQEVSHQILEKLASSTENSIFTDNLYYISRKDANRRFLVNEDSIISLLSSVGIQSIVLAGFSLADQVHTFLNCTLMVSIHGNGLTNMMWMPPGSSVIEIRRSGDSTNNCYFSLAEALGHKYYYIQAPSVDVVQDTHTANLIVDPDLLHITIEQAISR